MILNSRELEFFEHSVREIVYRLRGHSEYLRGIHGYTEIISALAIRYGISTKTSFTVKYGDYGAGYRVGFVFTLERSNSRCSAFFDMDIEYRGVIQEHGRGYRNHSYGRGYDIKLDSPHFELRDYQKELYEHFTKRDFEVSIGLGKLFDKITKTAKEIEKAKAKAQRKAKYEKEKAIKDEYEALCKETEKPILDYKKVSMYTIEHSVAEMKAEKARHVLTLENLEFILDNTAITQCAYAKILNHFTKYGQNV